MGRQPTPMQDDGDAAVGAEASGQACGAVPMMEHIVSVGTDADAYKQDDKDEDFVAQAEGRCVIWHEAKELGGESRLLDVQPSAEGRVVISLRPFYKPTQAFVRVVDAGPGMGSVAPGQEVKTKELRRVGGAEAPAALPPSHRPPPRLHDLARTSRRPATRPRGQLMRFSAAAARGEGGGARREIGTARPIAPRPLGLSSSLPQLSQEIGPHGSAQSYWARPDTPQQGWSVTHWKQFYKVHSDKLSMTRSSAPPPFACDAPGAGFGASGAVRAGEPRPMTAP